MLYDPPFYYQLLFRYFALKRVPMVLNGFSLPFGGPKELTLRVFRPPDHLAALAGDLRYSRNGVPLVGQHGHAHEALLLRSLCCSLIDLPPNERLAINPRRPQRPLQRSTVRWVIKHKGWPVPVPVAVRFSDLGTDWGPQALESIAISSTWSQLGCRRLCCSRTDWDLALPAIIFIPD